MNTKNISAARSCAVAIISATVALLSATFLMAADTIPPIIGCPANINVQCITNVPPCPTNLAQFLAAGGTASDNLDPSLEYHCVDSPLFGNICGGRILRTHTVVDDATNSASCVQIITIHDTIPPFITCPSNLTVPCPAAVPPCPTSLAEFLAAGGRASDNCDSNLAYFCIDGGVVGNTIFRTHTVVDDCTNSASCVQIITVMGNDCPPVIICSTNIVAECTGGLTPVTYSVTASNASGPVPVVCVPPSGTGFRLGTSNVVCTATDLGGNSSSCSFTVTVVDTIPPRVTCNSNIVTQPTSAAGAVVTYIASASDPCGIAAFNCAPPSGSTFPIGVTTVTCTASDTSRNTNSCSFTVNVINPNQCPTATNLTVSVAAGSSVSFQLPAGDPDGDPLQYNVSQPPAHGVVVVQVATGVASYSPNSGYCGPDSFKFTVTDGQCVSAAATVTINVECTLRQKKQQILAELIALRTVTSDHSDRDHLEDAIDHVEDSLAASLWVDDNHLVAKKGKKVFDEEEDAVDEFRDILEDIEEGHSDQSAAVIQDLIDRLVAIDRALAVISVDEAEAAGANPKKIKEDREEIEEGDEDAAEGRGDKAIKHYRDAWAHAVKLKVTGHAAMPSPAGFRLHFAGFAGEQYVLEVSPDFVHWTPLATITADAEGDIDYTDAEAALHPQRFYRVVQP